MLRELERIHAVSERITPILTALRHAESRLSSVEMRAARLRPEQLAPGGPERMFSDVIINISESFQLE